MLTNLEGMDRQEAIDQVVNAYNRNQTDWRNYLNDMNRIYRLAESTQDKEFAEQRERNRREIRADPVRIPLEATKEQEDEPVLAAQKSEEPPEQKREQQQLDRLNDGYQSVDEDSDIPDEERG